MRTASLCYPHYIVFLRFSMSVKRFIWRFLYFSGKISCDCTMNSDANELQFVSPSLLMCCVTDGTSSSAMLLTGLGPGSDAIISMEVPHSDWNHYRPPRYYRPPLVFSVTPQKPWVNLSLYTGFPVYYPQ